MHDQSDAQLLRTYAERGAESAFAEIVTRHTDLVYSAALRQVYSPDLARDVTQSVFTDLARKAPTLSANLSPEASLVGWLYRGTRFAARDLYRNETRRTQRERQAMEQLYPAPETSPDWDQLRPILDDAMSELDDSDRDAVLLRYFKNHDLRSVGATLGISDDAAQKRVSRAVECLREIFAKRGVTIGAGGLAVVISANAVQAAPVGLALTISTAAALTGTTLATTATVTATKAIAMTTLQKTIVTATIAVLTGAGIYEARQASQLRDQVQVLQQQQSPLTQQIAQLNQALVDATSQFAGLRDDNERLNRNTAELLRLRGEVAQLRRDSNELALLRRTDETQNEEESSYHSWFERVQLLKQKLELMPTQKNPENTYLTEDDWLQAAKRKLDTDKDYLAAFADLRASGEGNFLRTAETALRKFMETNSGTFPTELSQMKPYFDNPPSEEVLQRYHIVPASSIPQANMSGDGEGWLITLKQPDSGSLWTLGQNGMGGSNYEDSDTMAILAPALKALIDATTPINGRKNITMQQLEPYLSTSEQKAAYQKLIQRSKPTSK